MTLDTTEIYDDVLDRLAATLAELSFASLDRATITAARQRLFDTLAATAIGLETPEGKALLAVNTELSVPPLSRRVAEQVRRYVGATSTTEIDDVDTASGTTVGAVVVPVALVVASDTHEDGAKLITAIVAGYEAMIRLGRALGGATILYRGLWPTYVTAAFAAAATTAKLLGLDARATSTALALALDATSMPPAGAFVDSVSRYHALGVAAAEGAAAARRAAEGVDADPNAVPSFAARLNVRVEKPELVPSASARPLIHDVDTRMFPTSRQALASVEAFLSLAAVIDDHEDIERIIVHVPSTYRDLVDQPALPAERIESMIGVQYSIALAVFAHSALYDVIRPRLPSNPAITTLIAKIELRPSAQLDTLFPRTWGSTVTVHRKSGQLVTQEVLEPSGSRAHALDWRKLGRKVARIFAASSLANAQFVNRLLERCRTFPATGDPNIAADLLESIRQASAWPKHGGHAGTRDP